MDTIEDVGQPSQRIEPVLPDDADRAHGALGRVEIDADAAVFEKELEGGPAAEAVTDGLGEIALARNAQQLGLGPCLERIDHGARVLLARSLSQCPRLAGNLALYVVEPTDPIEGLSPVLGLRGFPDIMEVAPQVRPTRGLAELAAAIRTRCLEQVEAGIRICLKDAMAGL